MGLLSVAHLCGRRIEEAILVDAGGYRSTALKLRLDNDSVIVVKAIRVNYDQYSSSPALNVTEQEA